MEDRVGEDARDEHGEILNSWTTNRRRTDLDAQLLLGLNWISALLKVISK